MRTAPYPNTLSLKHATPCKNSFIKGILAPVRRFKVPWTCLSLTTAGTVVSCKRLQVVCWFDGCA